jgi:hypothetical protein
MAGFRAFFPAASLHRRGYSVAYKLRGSRSHIFYGKKGWLYPIFGFSHPFCPYVNKNNYPQQI